MYGNVFHHTLAVSFSPPGRLARPGEAQRDEAAPVAFRSLAAGTAVRNLPLSSDGW
jgi:hypothetical protein